MTYKKLLPLVLLIALVAVSLGVMRNTVQAAVIAQINFQEDPATVLPAGWDYDLGEAYDARINGDTYGWVLQGTTIPLDNTSEVRNRIAGGDILQTTLVHLQRDPANIPVGAWQYEIPNGTYTVTISVGDPNNTNSRHVINVEGIPAVDFIPSAVDLFREVSVVVNVTDGILNIDADDINADNSKLNYVIIEDFVNTGNLEVLGVLPANTTTNVATNLGAINVYQINSPTVGAELVDSTVNSSSVYLYPTAGNSLTDRVPASSIGVGGDRFSINFTPAAPLDPFTNYTFVITDEVEDTAGNTMVPFQSTFTTGATIAPPPTGVSFTLVPSGAATTVFGYPSLDIWNNRLYATTGGNGIYHWAINPDGTLSDQRVVPGINNRIIIGIDFDPASTPTAPIIWVSHNRLPAEDAGHFTGEISRLRGTNVGVVGETWVREDFVVGLPRSRGDHMVNSLQVGPDGALYVLVGGLSAMGEASSAWGNQPETILSAAMVRVNPNAIVPNAPVDVTTDLTSGDNLDIVSNGIRQPYGLGDPGLLYNPQTPGAAVTLYATGIRNAYDMVWHSNGNLYVPANGSAGGGAEIPQMPADRASLSQCQNRIDGVYDNTEPFVTNNGGTLQTQHDYLFRIVQGGYYGHPAPVRCEWIMNGGNPTPVVDFGQVGNHYPIGTLPDRNWDPNTVEWDFGISASPNGVIEYTNTTNFGGALAGQLLVLRYAGGSDILTMQVDGSGNIVSSIPGASIPGFSGFNQPLDITEDPVTGNLYVSEFPQVGFGSGGRILLLRANEIIGTPDIAITPPDPLIFDTVVNTTSPTQQLTITNNGDGDLNISTLDLIGVNPGDFNITNAPTLPTTLAPGASLVLDINFAPTGNAGTKVANIQIISTDPDTPNQLYELRGLATAGTGGQNEPSLQAILNSLSITTNVGDPDPSTTPLGVGEATADYPGPLTGEEVPMQTFVAANPAQPVTFEPIASYALNGNPPLMVGWHPVGDVASRTELFRTLSGQDQTLYPAISGTTQFTPGTTPFGLYTELPPWGNRIVSTQDSLNASWDANVTHKARVFPLRDENGVIEPNAFIVGYEEWTRGWDYNDIVFIVRNVQPAPVLAGGQIRFENLDWTGLYANSNAPGLAYLNRWMTFHHMAFPGADNGGTLRVHDQVTMRIHNDDPTTDITITGLTLDDPVRFILPNGENPTPATPIVIPPNSFYDLTVEFVEVNGARGVRYGTLTVDSSAGNEPSADITLAGGFMVRDEADNEFSLPQIMEAFGFRDNTNWPFNSQLIPRGEEVISEQWERADPNSPVYVRQLAALAGCCVATEIIRINAGPQSNAFRHHQDYGQSLLPAIQGDLNSPAEMISGATAPFTFTVSGSTSDDGFADPDRHAIRLFPVRRFDNTVVPDAYVLVFDYIPGGGCEYNVFGVCDYNDHVYLVTNIQPTTVQIDVAATITATPEDGLIGSPQIFEVVATNVSPFDSTNTVVTIDLPAELAGGITSAVSTLGTCNTAGNTVTCNVGTLPGNGTATINVTTNPTGAGLFNVSTEITTDGPETIVANNQATVQVQVNDPATLPGTITVVKDSNPSSSEVFTFNTTNGLGNGSFELRDEGVGTVLNFSEFVNFQPVTASIPNGYVADTGLGYNATRGYGWVSVGTTTPVDAETNTRDRNNSNNDQRLDTLMHMELANSGFGELAWMIDVPNGTYEVTVSVGEALPFFDSSHSINVNGVAFITNFVPTSPNRFAEATQTIVVTNGRIVVDSVGGTNTKINYVDIVGLTPGNTQVFEDVAPGTYNITEVVPANWNLANATCTGGDFAAVASGVAVTMDPGENIVCTFQNVVTNGPVVEITKSPDTQTIQGGTTATFNITVTNIGTVDLTNVTVTDALAPDCDRVFASMLAGTSQTYTCTLDNVTASFINTAEVIGTAADTSTATDSDTAEVIAQDVPAISIVKDADQTVAFGGTATFTMTVSNTGSLPLSNITVTDALCTTGPAFVSGDTNNDTTLQIDETWVYSCEVANVTADFTNTAEVSGTAPDTTVVTASDSAIVTVPPTPAATFDMVVDTPAVVSGGTAEFTLILENTGNVPLAFVSNSPAPLPCTPVAVSTDPNNNGVWDPGEVQTYECDIPNVTADFTNDFTFVYTDGTTQISLNDSASVRVVTINAPAIEIIKEADQLINSGDTASFTITVTNVGNANLTNVTVTDALAPTCDNTFATLAIGAAETYTCDVANVTADFVNTAEVVATVEGTADTVNDSDTANVTVFVTAPSISIVKSPATQTVDYDGTATFNIRVENNGNEALTNVGVIDPLSPTCANTIGDLAIGQVVEYTCQTTNVTADFTNTAIANGTTPASAIIDDSDTADVVVNIVGGIAIEKTPATQQIQSGETANFTLTVTNTGNSPLSTVTVTDDQCDAAPVLASGDANNDSILQTTETWVYNCSVANAVIDFTNTATAEGTAPDATVVNATDTADVDVLSAPGISIEKSPAVQTVALGDTATFTLTVTNSGDVPLNTVNVVDAICTTGPTLASGDDNTDGILQVTETWVYDCEVANVTAPFDNTATVDALAPDNITAVNASDSATVSVDTVNAPAIALDKTPAFQSVDSGTTVTFTITITNIGAVDLLNLAVTDDQCDAAPVFVSGDDNTDNILQTSETWVYTCDNANITAGITGTATVTAEDGAGANVTASDTSVIVINGSGAPVIALDKTPDSQTVNSGDTATFTITVTNPGTVDLLNVTVTDDQCAAAPTLNSGDDNTDGILQSTETWVYTCDVPNVTQPLTNTATVTADDGAGNDVSASDSAVVIVNGVVGNAPSIDLVATPATQSVLVNNPVSFNIIVVNNGNVDLENVEITDLISPTYADCNRTFATLAINEVQTYTCTVPQATVDFSNTLTVIGTHTASGVTVSDSEVVSVTVTTPPVSDNGGDNGDNGQPVAQQFTAFDPFVTKIADPPFAIPGEPVTFIFYVSNPGDVPATNVVAVDPIPADVEILSATAPTGNTTISGQDVIFSIDTLQPGETITVTIETRVRPDVATPFTITNEVCMNADNMPEQRCDTASVISVSALPATGETPLWSMILRGLLMIGGAVVLTVTGWMGYRFLNLRITSV